MLLLVSRALLQLTSPPRQAAQDGRKDDFEYDRGMNLDWRGQVILGKPAEGAPTRRPPKPLASSGRAYGFAVGAQRSSAASSLKPASRDRRSGNTVCGSGIHSGVGGRQRARAMGVGRGSAMGGGDRDQPFSPS